MTSPSDPVQPTAGEGESSDSLAQLAREGQDQYLAIEFWQFLKENGKWWLLPVVAVLLCIGALFIAAQTGLAPYLYALW